MGLEMWLQSFLMHLSVLLCLCSCSGFLTCQAASSFHRANETDRLALLAFKSKVTRDPLLTLSTWNESSHFCRWLGVTCGRRHRRVIALELDDRQLSGSISPQVGNLSFLKVLSLSNNSFTHIIPPEIGHLRRLKSLMLSNNSISGEIPVNVSAGCVNLVVLNLGRNNLHGNIPPDIGNGNSLSKLKKLGLFENKLSGRLPPPLGNLSSLERFSVAGNYISGTIPDSIGLLKNLPVILLERNRLTGTIPPSIFNLSSIRFLSLQMNQIHGNLPSDLGNTLPRLELFGIGHNLLSGSIPVSLSNASELHVLDLQKNRFVGKVPSLEKLHDLYFLNFQENQLGFGEADDLSFLSSLNATDLTVLSAAWNNLGGVLPGSIFNVSTRLEVVMFGGNKIFGDIPVEIGSLVNLERLLLEENQFSGEIPSNIGNLQMLQKLSLGNNKLSGKIPSSLGNLTFLTTLFLPYNNFHGSIPPDLWKCQYLEHLILSQNSLEGRIPPKIFSLPSLWFLDLSDNRLSGSLPTEVGNLKILENMYIENNLLSGEIPSTLGSCVTSRILFMHDNNFRGIIPPSLSNLRGIEKLDLSRNNLSGTIPNYFGHFAFLQNLNLSFNDFEGRVPEIGVFKNSTAISVAGNNRLCGGIPELQLPRCNFEGTKKKKSLSLGLKLATFMACGLLGSILVFGLGALFGSRKRCQEVSPFRVRGNPFLKVSYQELLKATDGFSPANLIGEGSFGSVYKGILDHHAGELVAVKVLNLQFQGALKSFKAECAVLKSIKHRNLVKVVTACSSIDHQGNDFKALVYEFMANGNLEKWLHPKRYEDEEHGESEPMNLSLMLRLNIAIDIASALDYFHHHCPKLMAHCDLKPSNVLLDDEMTAHVGDFGLARLLPQANRDDITASNQSSSIGLIGTVGYAPPEYGMGNEVSKFGDVYNYGIILLEMFTGKRPTHAMFSGTQNLHNYVKMALPEQVTQIADPELVIPQGDQTEECLIALFGIGIACSEECPRDRMDIKDALAKLHTIRSNLGNWNCSRPRRQ